jgi:superfamily I DNA and RNA helicase
LRSLLQVQRLDPRDVVVLTLKPELQGSLLFSGPLLHGYTLVRNEALVSKSSVLMSTVEDFKGLERLAVLVVDADDSIPEDEKLRSALFYVAFSRAKMLLKVFVKTGVQIQGLG